MGGGDPENGEGLGDLVLEPVGEPGGLLVAGCNVPKATLGLGQARTGDYRKNVELTTPVPHCTTGGHRSTQTHVA